MVEDSLWETEESFRGLRNTRSMERKKSDSSSAQTQKVRAQCYRARAGTKHLIPPAVLPLARCVLVRKPRSNTTDTL